MILAAVGDTGYNIMLFVHIVAVLAAMAPAFTHPVLQSQLGAVEEGPRRQVFGFIAKNSQRIYAVALIVAGIAGFGLVGMSDDVYSLGDGWVIASIIVWIAMNGVLHAVQIPAERGMAEGDPSAEAKTSFGGMALTAMMLVLVYLMVFQPGA